MAIDINSAEASGKDTLTAETAALRTPLKRIKGKASGPKPEPEPVKRKTKTGDAIPLVKQAQSQKVTKADLILKKLRTAKGASIEMLIADTGWQAHSVRGFLSATVKKKMALNLASEVGKDGTRRYRIEGGATLA